MEDVDFFAKDGGGTLHLVDMLPRRRNDAVGLHFTSKSYTFCDCSAGCASELVFAWWIEESAISCVGSGVVPRSTEAQAVYPLKGERVGPPIGVDYDYVYLNAQSERCLPVP